MLLSTPSIEQRFLLYVREMMHLQEVLNLLFWDTRTVAPQKGSELRSETIGTITSKKVAMSTSPEMKTFLEELYLQENYKKLSASTRKTLEHVKKDYELLTKIPLEEYKEYVIVRTNAGKVWEAAKSKSDFSLFQPYLEKLVEFNKRFISYWGYKGNRYNALLDVYDPGVTVEQLDDVFGKLKERIIPLLKQVTVAKDQPASTFLVKHFPLESQKQFQTFILNELGYDYDAGRLDETVHPFAIPINRNDVRITTRYNEFDFRSALFGTIHEFGHALYEQNISPDLIGTPLCEGTSAGIHESQSLFWEKMIGRHKGFWQRYLPALQQCNPDQFAGVDFEEFYRAINAVRPSYNRVEADELTYPLHVILRYELEKDLFNDRIHVGDLPEIWRQKMQDYLGIVPPDDEQGVLQDMHWSIGMFGQFPSYALGYLYAAQFRNALVKEGANLDHRLQSGDFALIREWLTRKIHVHGKMKDPNELLLEVTGETVNPDYLIAYLEEKYTDIYKLSLSI